MHNENVKCDSVYMQIEYRQLYAPCRSSVQFAGQEPMAAADHMVCQALLSQTIRVFLRISF
jgi:hypothetical protein